MPVRLKRSAVAIVATASLLALAACGGDGGDNPEAPTPSLGEGGGAGAGKNPTLEGPLAIPDDAAQGGTATVLTIQVPATLDPTRAYFTDSTEIMNLVTRALTQYAYNPENGEMELVPDMATNLGVPNEDNTEWTFTLKDGLKYEDGTDVTAEDVAYAISRSFAIEELPDGPTYQLQFFLDGETYKGPYKDKTPYTGVEVNGNDTTIRCRARSPRWTTTPRSRSSRASRRPRTRARSTATTAGHRPVHVRGLQARHVADAGQEPQLGSRHRPRPHPVGRHVGVQVR